MEYQDKMNLELINVNFVKCIKGYHMINTSPVNETIWEDLNSLIFTTSNIDVYTKSDGSHLSGMDIDCSIGKISNKSAKYSYSGGVGDKPFKQCFDISSYRLTTVCSEKQCGTPTDFIQEINNRKNFDYYSFIIRSEINLGNIKYDWILIPSNHPILDPASYTWEPTLGKRGKNKDSQIGWHTNDINGCKMSIVFSMSSQLWIHIEMTEEIEKFVIATTTIKNTPSLNYIQLSEISV